jgi:hypothetical protein
MATQNKMRRLQEAKREWAVNHSDSSPFPVHKLLHMAGSPAAGGSPGAGMSPFNPSKSFAIQNDLN